MDFQLQAVTLRLNKIKDQLKDADGPPQPPEKSEHIAYLWSFKYTLTTLNKQATLKRKKSYITRDAIIQQNQYLVYFYTKWCMKKSFHWPLFLFWAWIWINQTLKHIHTGEHDS